MNLVINARIRYVLIIMEDKQLGKKLLIIGGLGLAVALTIGVGYYAYHKFLMKKKVR